MDLSTSYLGLELTSPFVVGASPLTDHPDGARRLQDAGASAVVLRSLFEEQLGPAVAALSVENGYAAAGRTPGAAEYAFSPGTYLRHLGRLKRALTIPVIASLNGHRPGGWVQFASRLEDAGADAIELNFYRVETDPTVAADQVEIAMLETLGAIAGAVRIPVAVKLSPYHAALAQLAVALELAGAAGVTVFNRFYQPDVDTQGLGVQPTLRLSEPGELLLRLRWLAILSPLLNGSLAATGGVVTAHGAAKAILTGAHAVQVVSAILRHGEGVIGEMRQGLQTWMAEHGFGSIADFRGRLNQRQCADPEAFERANYIRVLQNWRS
jgi:dihydroorotate dehydrogenase (fumarate)